MKIDNNIVLKYSSADDSFLINCGHPYKYEPDPSLIPIRISLPTPPPLNLIDGYGLKPENQIWRRPEIPAKFIQLEKEVKNFMEANSTKNDRVTGFKIVEEIWRRIHSNIDYYEEEIKWIKKMWWHRLYGYWVFIKGKPTYLCPWHFFYLTFWKIDGSFYPEYRDKDRRELLAWTYFNQTNETFKNLDDKDKAVLTNGIYEIEELLYNTFFGIAEPKGRRQGVSNKAQSCQMEVISRKLSSLGVIFSMTEDSASKLFRNITIRAFRHIPFFFLPTFDGYFDQAKEIFFNRPKFTVIGNDLQSRICHAESAYGAEFDGMKIDMAVYDEEGKCFGKGTEILMYDGSIKNVENILVGDKIMGNDSTPRTVLSLGRGKEKMYKIIPKKGKEWICNESHILALKYCQNSANVYKKGFYNITVRDFLKIKKSYQKGFMLYKSAVEFSQVKHEILSPYYLGLWLGDGSHSNQSIVAIDNEIIDYIYHYAENLNMNVSKYTPINRISCYCITNTIRSQNNKLLNEFKRYNLIKNKHIPSDYLIDSRKNRLELLAGIIDTDGSKIKNDNKRCYEITQKRKQLALDIEKLALSLGFYAKMYIKKTSMKRKDNTLYISDVYRIRIFGKNIHEIPCKLQRKKYNIKTQFHKNTRESLHTGFKIEELYNDSYYGFTIDGNHLFLLSDYTVVHNTKEVDITKRWTTHKRASALGLKILGFSFHVSTTEDLDVDGGKHFQKMVYSSNFYHRNHINGQTATGLATIFFPAYDGYEECIDYWGQSVIDTPTDEQKKYGYRSKYGARQILQSERDILLRSKDPRDKIEYRRLVVKFPFTLDECFQLTTGSTSVDLDIINKRNAELRRMKEPFVLGNFEWVDEKFGNVHFVPCKEGRWEVSRLLNPGECNLKVLVPQIDEFTGSFKEVWRPKYPNKYTLGSDPFDFKGDKDMAIETGSRMSDGGIAVFWERDFSIDPEDKNIYEWESCRFVAVYRNRPLSKVYKEDVLKAAIYYGAMVYPETNKPSIWEYLDNETDFGGYLLYDWDEATKKFKNRPGVYQVEKSKQEIWDAFRNHIAYRGQKECHMSLLTEIAALKTFEDLTRNDMAAAAGLALLGSKSRSREALESIDDYGEDYTWWKNF